MSRARRLSVLQTLFPQRAQPNNPTPRQAIQRLKFIGPLFATRLATTYGLYTLQHLITYMRTHTRQQNEVMLQTALLNPKAQQCLAPPRRMHPPPCPCTYHVRDTNRMAYNAIIYYALQRNVPLARIPRTHRARTPRSAYPNIPCGTAPAAPRRRSARRRGRR